MPSTNSTLRELIRAGWAEHGSTVWADEQTAGRGRLDRHWVSSPGGGLYLSVYLSPVELRLTHCLAALAVRAAVLDVAAVVCELKWPNDVLLNGRKMSGILAEETPDGAIVGIGINTNLSETEVARIGPEAASIRASTGVALDHSELLRSLLRHLEEHYIRSSGYPDQLFHEWKRALVTLGQTVEVETTHEKWLGRAVDVAMDGSLLVLNDKRLVRVYAGDVRIRPQ